MSKGDLWKNKLLFKKALEPTSTCMRFTILLHFNNYDQEVDSTITFHIF